MSQMEFAIIHIIKLILIFTQQEIHCSIIVSQHLSYLPAPVVVEPAAEAGGIGGRTP